MIRHFPPAIAGPILVAATLALALLLGSCAAGPGASGRQIAAADLQPVRGLWVTRWDYASPADVERAIRDAADIGISDVYVQVRGRADAFYRSELEPWGTELLGDRPGGPGFDPLEVAARAAERHDVRLHAWVNVMPIWRGPEPPDDENHPLRAHPGWRLTDAEGTPQPLHDGYVIANPALPEVRDHLAEVMGDIASRYDIDGLHLDYIRFVGDELEKAPIRPADQRTLAAFRTDTGREGIDSPENRRAFRDWMRGRITRVAARISDAARDARPGLELSATVWRRPDLAREEQLQDYRAWLDQGLVDRLVPMIYTEDHARLKADLAAWRDEVEPARLTPGLGVYKHDPSDTPRQIAIADGRGGYALFAYASIFDSPSRFQDDSDQARRQRTARRDVLTDLSHRLATAGD